MFYLSSENVLTRYGFSRATLYRLINGGLFPKPSIYISTRMPRWKLEDLENWESEQKGGGQNV